jgi:hypothetical protein
MTSMRSGAVAFDASLRHFTRNSEARFRIRSRLFRLKIQPFKASGLFAVGAAAPQEG